MLGVRKIDVFVLKKFFLLFLGCFCICLFVFMMQFVWKHIDSLVGKGLGVDVLMEFFWYMALSLVPMALPMAVGEHEITCSTEEGVSATVRVRVEE